MRGGEEEARETARCYNFSHATQSVISPTVRSSPFAMFDVIHDVAGHHSPRSLTLPPSNAEFADALENAARKSLSLSGLERNDFTLGQDLASYCLIQLIPPHRLSHPPIRRTRPIPRTCTQHRYLCIRSRRLGPPQSGCSARWYQIP